MSSETMFMGCLVDRHRPKKHKEILDNLFTYNKRIRSKITDPPRVKYVLVRQRASDIYLTDRLSGGYRTTTNSWNNQESSSFLFNSNDPALLIREYFLAKPDDRIKLRKNTAKHINSVEAVLEILEWSTKSRVQEAYDGAIDLLAECSDVILKVANKKLINYANDNSDVFALEEKWEVLIKGIACAQNIPAKQRLDTISRLIPESKRRLVKTAVIDALRIMQDEVDTDSIKNQLAIFLSSKESDKYIQDYAKEAMEEVECYRN